MIHVKNPSKNNVIDQEKLEEFTNCEHCGMKIESDSEFCRYCGKMTHEEKTD